MAETRREFTKALLVGLGLITIQRPIEALELSRPKPPSPVYENITHTKPEWKEISKGLEFTLVEVHRNNDLVDKIAVLRADSQYNKLNVYTQN